MLNMQEIRESIKEARKGDMKVEVIKKNTGDIELWAAGASKNSIESGGVDVIYTIDCQIYGRYYNPQYEYSYKELFEMQINTVIENAEIDIWEKYRIKGNLVEQLNSL